MLHDVRSQAGLLAIQKDTRLSIGETKGFRREESRVAARVAAA